jgi:hypothetical protein
MLSCYHAIEISGPFYTLSPLPFTIAYFWHHCETRIKGPSLTLSMEGSLELDKAAADAQAAGRCHIIIGVVSVDT